MQIWLKLSKKRSMWIWSSNKRRWNYEKTGE